MRVLFLTDSLSDLDGVGRYAMRLIAALEAPAAGPRGRACCSRASTARPPRPCREHWDVSVGLPPDYFFYMSPPALRGELRARRAPGA